jgi:hypothetical protein
MSGINPNILATRVARLLVKFQDDLGNTLDVSGTGFWVKNSSRSFFITNRHNLDATLKLGPDTKYKIVEVAIQLRRCKGDQYFAETLFGQCDAPEIRLHATADVGAICEPKYKNDTSGFGHDAIRTEEIATQDFLATGVAPMDFASFIGFPGRSSEPWWDKAWEMAIARTVNIASLPAIRYSNPAVLTGDVMLVSGLSFSGSSGSPVILHSKGIKLGGALTGGNYVPAKVIGIMSGHWWNDEPRDGMFFHSGLSYLTRSTAIHDVVG